MHLFCIQTAPDIDVIVPIVHQLSINKHGDVMVICINPRHDIKNDYLLQYLINELKVEVLHLHQVNLLIRAIFGFIFTLSSIFSYDLREKLDARLIRFLINLKWFFSFLKNSQLSSVTIDEAIPPYGWQIASLAKALKIKVIISPTGISPARIHSREAYDSKLYFDFRLVPPQQELHDSHLEYNNIIKISFPRYCLEWQKVNSNLLKNAFKLEDLPSQKNKLKVLIFGLPDKNFDFLKNHPLVKRVFDDNNFTVIYKDKPRVLKGDKYDKYPSALLIQWADAVICPMGSIVMDIFYYKKMFIYPKYLAPDWFGLFEDYDIYWQADNEDEVHSLLKQMHSMDNFNAPKTLEIENFYNKMVYINDSYKKNALTEYSSFYQDLV
jgi:hypothetical protein